MPERSLKEILISSAEKSLSMIDKDRGSFPAGVNGPHGQEETSVRNTAHWLLVHLKCYQLTNDSRFLDAVSRALSFLLSAETRPYGFSYHQRLTGNGDKCNGVIGQAWVIEALAQAGLFLKKKEALDVALESYKLLPFVKRVGLWKRVEIDGTTRKGLDLTVNHQIWLAAAASPLMEHDDIIRENVWRFLDCLGKNIRVDGKGCFIMPVNSFPLLLKFRIFDSIRASDLYRMLRRVKKQGVLVNAGYHAFHLYGLAMLRENVPQHPVWQEHWVVEGLNYLLSDHYKENVLNSKYGIGYNPPGFEAAYSLMVFGDLLQIDNTDMRSLIENWIKLQVTMTFNPQTFMMDKVLHDPQTYSARIYEATRLNDQFLDTKVCI